MSSGDVRNQEPIADDGRSDVPAWRRRTSGEGRWPSVAAVVVAVVLELVLPARLALLPHWLLPAVEVALLVALVGANPVRLERNHPAVRGGHSASWR